MKKAAIAVKIYITVLAMATAFVTAGNAQTVQSPEEFLGHEVGADYKLVPWPRIDQYFSNAIQRSALKKASAENEKH